MKEKAIFLATQARNNKTFYEHSKVGYNYRMNSLAASFGLNQFPFLQKYISGRRKMNQFYKNIFDDKPGVSVFTESTDLAFSNHWLTCILIDENTSKVNCNDIKEAFVKNNIEYRPLWNPMHLQPLFKTNTFFGEEVSKQLFKYGLCLPSNVNYSTLELAKIKKVINDLFL
ncbi:DegT/DnrJ/EryC1/StrS family aminotransferase [Polaribacter tangerinus]|uniref:DegT/DnrJ/EryC1/StrS family aminotransferase n=1 Tax=Polaribacter tangerinus TaxID=1920034 RepID=UPI000B4AA2EF|nr:DegT/DnrJ/EryC1/StrS family aminotransferase [Polaribacter tangerinus]